MKINSEEYENLCEEHAGYCKKCDEITSYDVEPDAEGYECEQCQNLSVMGLEGALILGHVEITDDEEIEEDEDFDDYED